MYVFTPAVFRSLYPEFVLLTDDQINNSYYGSLKYSRPLTQCLSDNEAGYIINLVVAHLLELSPFGSGGGAPGRVTSATTGSVSTSFGYNPSESGFWWNSTVYGQQIWQEMLSHGGATYVAGSPFRFRNCIGRRRNGY